MNGIKVLNFHEINNPNEVKWFEDIIIYLKSKKIIISCDDLNGCLNNDKNLKESYLLTVDDGHNSFYKNIYPIIHKHNVPIALFVSPKICKEKVNFWYQEMKDYDSIISKQIISELINIPIKEINDISFKSILKSLEINVIHEYIARYQKVTNTSVKTFQNMTINNLVEVKKSGLVTIGAHTLNHPILLNENNDISKYEIDESIDELSNILDQKIKYFAYPNGIPKIDYSYREMEYVKSKGVNISFSTNFKKVFKKNNLMDIPRGEISNGRFSFAMKIFLWNYWRGLANIKNGQKELDDRNKMSELLRNIN